MDTDYKDIEWNKNLRDNKPAEGIPVLIYIPTEPEGEKYHVKIYNPDYNNWCDTNLDYWEDDDRVSHWIELPSKPKI